MQDIQPEKQQLTSQWPGAFGIYEQSKDAIMNNIKSLLTLIAVLFGVSILTGALFRSGNLQIISSIINNLFSISIAPAFIVIFLKSIDGKKIEAMDAVNNGLRFIIRYFFLSILVVLVLFASTLALIVPFLFIMPRLILAPYFLIDQNLGIIDALEASWTQTKGHSGKVWGVVGASIVMVLPALTIIGIPVAFYLSFMYSAASGILYKHIASQKS